ncbi:MAG: M13 family peptidase, partial [Arenibacter algicola]|nr:M13 family peptidase [Arenibacter algicola]
MKTLYYVSLIFWLCISCTNEPSLKSDSQTVDRTVVFEGITDSIKPGDNFFDHVNRTWFNKAVIAEDQVGVGSYRFLNIPQQELLKNILQEVSQQENPKGSIEQKVGDFYA